MKYLAGLGVGGIVAVVIFIIYRLDRKAYECQLVADHKAAENQLRADRIFMEDRLTKMLEQDQKTREENTRAVTELTTVLLRMNGDK